MTCQTCGAEMEGANCPNCEPNPAIESTSSVQPPAGPTVEPGKMFCSKCGKQIDAAAVVCPNCGVATANFNQAQSQPSINIVNTNSNVNTNQNKNTRGGVDYPQKSKMVAAILCFFLGVIGVHRFYVGKVGTGLLWLVTFGFCGIGALIDFIVILVGGFRDKYGMPLK